MVIAPLFVQLIVFFCSVDFVFLVDCVCVIIEQLAVLGLYRLLCV